MKDEKCIEDFKCDATANCSACQDQTVPIEYQLCTACKENYVPRIIFRQKVPLMICEDPNENDLHNCASSDDDFCLFCKYGYWMNEDGDCIPMD